jgi:hypothetical protein
MDRKPFNRAGLIMEHGPAYLKTQALRAAETRLKKAVTFTDLNIKNPLFQKRMGKGATSVFVRLEWPGVLSVIDPETGELLAVSEPGKPGNLSKSFMPPVPALAGAGSGGGFQGGRYGNQQATT